MSILLGAFSTSLNWLYGVNIFITGAIAFLYFKPVRPSGWELSSVILGVAVAGIWFLLVPENPVESASTSKKLLEAPLWASAIWLVFRLLGAVLVVPIVEEMAFRGAIQPVAVRFLSGAVGGSFAACLGIILSSVVFAALHTSIVAGFIASLLYGWIRHRSNSLLPPIIAHVVTNLIISMRVILNGEWSFW